MEPGTDLIQNENLLENGGNKRIIPLLEVFAQKEKEEILRRAVAEIEILRQQVGLLQNKFYRNIWSKFLNSFGAWLRENDKPVFLECFMSLSNKFNTLITGFWLLEGFLSLKSGGDLNEISKQKILEILKSVSLKHSHSLHSLKRREYYLIVSLFSKYFELFSKVTWKDWVAEELSGISSSQKLSFQQKLVFDIVLYYIENVHSDQILTNELIFGIINGFSSIIASDIDSCFKLSLESMIRILPNYIQELNPLINSLLRQLKKYSSKPLSQLSLLETFTHQNIISHFQKEEVLKEVFPILSEAISGSIGSIISNGGKADQNPEDIQIIQNSLNFCFQLTPSHFNLQEWLEETILAISSSKTNDQSKVSLLLIVGSVHESLTRYRIEGIPVNYNLNNKTQDLLLFLIDIKLPMVSSQSSDHFKSLAVHICSLSYVLFNGSKNHPFSDKFLGKVQSLIKDPSINETCKLLVMSSFTHSVLLLRKLGITKDVDLFDKPRVKQIIISNNISRVFGSTLNKNVNLKRLSMAVLGQIISIQDVFDETNIFKNLDIVSSIRTSPLLFPKLGTLIDGSYSFYHNKNNNIEANILLVLTEIVFNENSKANFNIHFQKEQEEEQMDLKSYLLTLSDPSKIQSANYLISFLIQMGRVLSFLPDQGDLSYSVSQYSAVNVEVFQASLMLPGLKKPIMNRICDDDVPNIQQKWFPLPNHAAVSTLLSEKSFCQNLILSFATILSSVNSLLNKNREQGILDNEICNELMLPRVDFFKVWVSLGNLEIISKGDPSSIGYSYYLIFLLCSYHPLLYSGRNTMSVRPRSFLNRKNELLHETMVRDLVSSWEKSKEIKEKMNKKFVQLYKDLTYLPSNDTSGFRSAGMNLLNIIALTGDSKLTLSLIEELKIKFISSLEFLNGLPEEFGNFVISDPKQVFEFNINMAASQNSKQGFIQDLQSNISAKLKFFTSSESKYGEFSELYNSLTNSLTWLDNTLSNLDNISSSNNSNKEPSEHLISKNKDLESDSIMKSSSSNTASSTGKSSTSDSKNVTTTSAFALAKLRKSQADNKSKTAKTTKTPALHANNTNARSHANSNTGNNLSTCNSILGANNGTGCSNLTKGEILRQRLTEQNNLRKDAERIISTIKNQVNVIVGVLLSWISELGEESKAIHMMDLELSEVLYSVCSKMLEFKPLRQYGLGILERLFERLLLEKNRLGRSMVEYLSKQDDESRNMSLQEILDSINFKRPSSVQIYLKNSIGISVLVYIISRVLYSNCKERGTYSDKQIQVVSQLIQYLSVSIRHGGLKVSMVHLSNMLYLYVLALGDLADLDQYLYPLKVSLSELRPLNMGEVDLVSSLLVFANPQVRLLTLESLKRALDNSKMEISYFTFMNLSIAREIQVFSSNPNNGSFSDDLSLISSISEELIEMYYSLARNKVEFDLDVQNKKLVDDLIEIQMVPVISTLQQRNISKTILRVSDKKHCSEIVQKVIASSERVFNDFERRRIFSNEDWPNNLTKSLISGMVPSTIRHFDSVIPNFTESGSEKIVSRIQARHALKGLALILSDLVIKLDESDFSFIEKSIRFVLTQMVDSNVFEDYISERERLSSEEANLSFKSKEKKTVKNLVGNFGNRQDSPEKIKIQGYDISSKEELQKVIVEFFVSLSSRHDIQKLSSNILIILRDLSSQYRPRTNPKEFHNFLAFAIGSIASCCSTSDPVVYKITCKIINELLSGSLVRNNGQNNIPSDLNSKMQFPMLTDIPQEYSRILPRLFEMLYNNQENEQGLRINRFEDLDKSRYLKYKIVDFEDLSKGEKLSVYELYCISLCKALYSENPGERIGAAHLFGSLSKGISVRKLRDFGILEAIENALKCQDGQKTGEVNNLEGLLLCIGSISLYLEYIIEPYTVQFLKYIVHLFSGGDQRIRFYSEKSAEIIIKNLSRYGTRLILPIITEGIEEKQWRIKLTSLQLLGIMALNSPHQLSSYLPKAIQTIYQTTSDSHPKVSDAARETLFKMASLIKNPEVNCISQDLITSLIDPTELNFKKALLSLKSVTFVHAIDITTLSLIFPVLLKTIQERGGTDLKKDAIQILTSLLLLLSDKTDIDPFLPLIENSIHNTLTDPIPEIRLLTAKLCRALVTVTGQEKASSLLSWLFKTLSMEVGQTLKSGVSASLAEVLSAFGIEKFSKILPFIVSQINKGGDDSSSQSDQAQFENQKNSLASDTVLDSSSTSVVSTASAREGYIGLFVYLPQSFGEDLGPLMPKILPVLLSRLGDESDSVREVALKACKALVVQFGSDHAAYILQPLEEGLGNDSWRVRLSSCSLLGTLLNRLIKSQLDSTGRALSTNSSALGDAGFSMHRRSYILAAIYMARSDENTSVKNSATALWKSLVQNTPQTLKDILTILIRRIINALSTSSNGNIHYIAVQSLKDLLDKFGSTLYNKLLPIFYRNLGGSLNEDGTISLDSNSNSSGKGGVCSAGENVLPNRSVRIGSCVGVLEILKTVRKSELKALISLFLPVVKIGLCDEDLTVRTYSVECLDIFASENTEILFSIINWLMDEILTTKNNTIGDYNEQGEDPKISTIELIIQLSHSGIVSNILPRVISDPMTINKIRIIKSMSKIPSQNRLRSSLFEIVPKLIEISTDIDGKYDEFIQESSKEAMMSIIQSLEAQSMESFATILLDIIRENTPSTNLSISGRYQIENLKINDFSELIMERETLMRIKAIEFLTLSLFASSTIYETSISILIKYLIPLALCDISEQVRISASKAFHLFSTSVPRKSVIQVCNVMKESISTLVHDPIDNSKRFTENKLIGYSWKILNGKVLQSIMDKEDISVRSENNELLIYSNKLIDSISSVYIQGISQGSVDSKEECAIGLREVIQLTNSECLKPIAVKLVGPLIRSISDRTTSSSVRGALLSNLVIFLESCGLQLRPLLPQIQTILVKFLLDPNENVRKQCSYGIGFLSRLLGNRAEVLLSDLCSLASKQSQSGESMNALLSSINLSLLSNSVGKLGENQTKPVISELLRNKLIGMALSYMEESKDFAIKDISGQILSSILINYCQEEEIKDILLPLLIVNDQNGCQLNQDKNILNIFNSCCESNGWSKMYSSLRNFEEDIISNCEGEEEEDVYSGNMRETGIAENIDKYLSIKNRELMIGGRILPEEILENQSWWIYKKTVVILYKYLVYVQDNNNNSQNSSSYSQLRKLSLNFLYNLTKTAVENNDTFSASIVLQVLPLIFEKDLLILFPSFSDTHMILEIQKICEKIVESQESRRLFQQQIYSNLSCYSFGNFIKQSDIDSRTQGSGRISSQDILFSLVSLPSIQSLSSKFPAVKLKAEQFLVSLIKLIIQLRENQDQHIIKKNNSSNRTYDEEASQFELVISEIISAIEKIYPGHLNQQKANFIREYSRRVLSKASN
ncbi:HEAT repeat family [Cryptosporidium sp. chipmunk genotype I]|uniref:HEAT repeat family n=1 Tax=Cryptosporidium sp. chipmunk genotype I TaxID=1280935 RepID=UPI00351A23BB|nr:HEAT repeat family [Cryptosporidium sp. chipmunk genotype I]